MKYLPNFTDPRVRLCYGNCGGHRRVIFAFFTKKCACFNSNIQAIRTQLNTSIIYYIYTTYLAHNLLHTSHTVSTHMPTKSTTSTLHAFNALQQYITNSLINKYNIETKQHKNIHKYLDKHLQTIVEDLAVVVNKNKPCTTYPDAKMINKEIYQSRWGRITLPESRPFGSNVLLPMLTKSRNQGYSGLAKQVSSVVIDNPILLDAIHELAVNSKPTKVIITATSTVSTYCNRRALEAFTSTDTRNISDAKFILAQLDMHDMFLQGVSDKPSNRIYLTGINIQNISKDLRSTVLATQWAYDLNCAVFALFASVAHTLTGTEQTVLFNYIHNRDVIRNHISQQTGLTVKQVKAVLTSVGFGKHATGANDLAVVLTTEVGKEIVDAFRKCVSIVLKHYPKPKDVRRGTYLSELFYKWETETMNNFIQHTNQSANARIHDCVVFTKPANIKHILSKIQLSFTTQLQYINYEEEQL